MSKAQMIELAKFFGLVGISIWGWKEVSKRNATARRLLTQ